MIDPRHPDFSLTPASRARASIDFAPADAAARPCVTIVTPFFNSGQVFHETANSVRRQSFQQWEWLIVNDGSTDRGSLAMLGDYRRCDPRVRVIDHAGNRGLSAARNTGYRAARTEYVLQLDSDDLLEPTAIEKWYWCLVAQPGNAFVKGFTVGFGAETSLWRHGFHDRAAFLRENLVSPTALVRKSVHEAAGGYDESIRHGLEDWEFWIRCASRGYWGTTVPEYLDWYRRRDEHWDRWPNVSDGRAEQFKTFRARLRRAYPELSVRRFPRAAADPIDDRIPDELPCSNNLRRDVSPVLMIVAPDTGRNERLDVQLLGQLKTLGREVTVTATSTADHTWLAECTRHTPDVFALGHFLPARDYPRFLRYLVESRHVEVVLVSSSAFGYKALSYLHSCCPDLTFVDYLDVVDPQRQGVEYPHLSMQASVLDLTLTGSQRLKDWMVENGAREDRIQVYDPGVDTKCRPPDHRGAAEREDRFGAEQMGLRLMALLEEAKRLHRERPRPEASPAAARSSALDAVTHARRAAAVHLWRQDPHRTLPRETHWTYFAARQRLLPIYHWGIQRGWRWLVPLKQRVREALTRRPSS